MSGRRRRLSGAAILIFGACSAIVTIGCAAKVVKSSSLTGAVLEGGSDPRRQRPMANADVALITEDGTLQTKSDASGLFHFTITPAMRREALVTLSVQHAGYRPWETTSPIKDEIYIARLTPLHAEPAALGTGTVVPLRDLRVRYSVKSSATMDIGSFAQTFEISGSGGVPCQGGPRCSPDGQWKAMPGSVIYDAGQGNQFREVRVSCIAGPCPFTSIAKPELTDSNRKLRVSALDWSDTATFLVEAEVTRTQIDDVVRYSIPVVFGSGMNFALPADAQGPSLEADMNGTDIVFPLGPNLYLSWAVCTLKTDTSGSKLYRCELKPGYAFR